MFDIDKIILEYPNAWRECLIFFGYDIEDRGDRIFTYEDIIKVNITDDGNTIILWMKYGSEVEYINIRALYSFFDSKGMVIIPCTNLLRSKKFFMEEDHYRIYMVEDIDRNPSEWDAFIKGFELLELNIINDVQ